MVVCAQSFNLGCRTELYLLLVYTCFFDLPNQPIMSVLSAEDFLRPAITSSTSSLEPYAGEWTSELAAHLVRRTHFGLKTNDLNTLRSFDSASEAVAHVIQQALNTPMPDAPGWYNQNPSGDILDMYGIQFEWMDAMFSGGLINRMKLFWSNHFAVSYQNMNALPSRQKAGDGYTHVMYEYAQRLHAGAMGDWRELVRSISKSPAMLYYLNNYANTADAPNEDFARELLELFTVSPRDKNGQLNYTEEDVAEVARAVTGWVVLRDSRQARFVQNRHDTGAKTIFGQTGNYNLDSLIDLIFSVKTQQTAYFLCNKLYTYFVSPLPDATVVQTLAEVMISADFNIAQTLQVLFSSQHFYQPSVRGSRIKSPVELYMSFFRELDITPDARRKEYVRIRMQENSNEEMLRPSTVFGWDGYNPPKSDQIPGHYTWLNTNYLPMRWQSISDLLMVNREDVSPFSAIRTIERISDPANPFAIARDLAQMLLAIPLEEAGIAPVEADFAGDPDVRPDVSGYTDKEIDLVKHLLGTMPWYEWTVLERDGVRFFRRIEEYRIRQFIGYLIQLPAYQLF